ncbi:MAG: hypothetical protein H6838_19015 [Planctomycetes bacterium]|nr:hypothetical protein [Planctomycetota bacterium]
MRKDLVFGVALLLAAAAAAQGEARPLVWRDFTAVQRLRVVCSNKHFGRLDDLLVAVPGGQITAAVVTMPQAQGPRRVVVPFAELQLDSGANLLQLAACTEEGHVYAAFDPESLGVTARVGDDGSVGEPAGLMSVAALSRGAVALAEGEAKAHGATVEMSRGHLAFLDLAVAPRPGDAELHPVPWAALRWQERAGEGQRSRWVLQLPRSAAALAATPDRIDVIVSDPLYRAKVHAAFEVRPPDYETDR